MRMDFFFILIMLWVMMISSLVLPSLLPYPSYVAFVGLVVLFLWHLKFFKTRLINSKNVAPIILYLVIIFVICFLVEEDIQTLLRQVVILGLLAIVLLSANQKQLASLLRSYVVFCIVMATAGTIASILVNTGIVDWKEFLFSLNDWSDGRISRDADVAYGYSFPYGLGLVLTSSYLYNFMGVEFFRSTGWAHEPTSATFFVLPALIILMREQIFSKMVRIFGALSIMFFWLACFAVGSIIAAAGLVFVVLMLRRNHFLVKILLCIILFFCGIYGYMEMSAWESQNAVSNSVQIFESKFASSSESLRAVFFIFHAEPAFQFFIASYLVLVMIFSLSALRHSDTAKTFGLIFIYLLFHSAKGTWGHLTQFPFTFVFFFFLVYSLHAPLKDGFFLEKSNV